MKNTSIFFFKSPILFLLRWGVGGKGWNWDDVTVFKNIFTVSASEINEAPFKRQISSAIDDAAIKMKKSDTDKLWTRQRAIKEVTYLG